MVYGLSNYLMWGKTENINKKSFFLELMWENQVTFLSVQSKFSFMQSFSHLLRPVPQTSFYVQKKLMFFY